MAGWWVARASWRTTLPPLSGPHSFTLRSKNGRKRLAIGTGRVYDARRLAGRSPIGPDPERLPPMESIQTVLLVAYLLIVLAMIAVILLQRSEGGGLGMGGNAG